MNRVDRRHLVTAGQIPVNLAKATAAHERQDRPLIITVTAEGELFVRDPR
jgi:biopolymer transport protein ExbD